MTDDGQEEPITNQGQMAGPPRPRWVKNLLLALLVVAAVATLVMLLAGGEHGPGRHRSLGSEDSPYASEAGHR